MADTQTDVGSVDNQPNIVAFTRIKQLRLTTSNDVIASTRALIGVLGKKQNELFVESQPAIFRLVTGEVKILATNLWGSKEVLDNPDKYLRSCDFVHFIEQLAFWLVDNPQTTQQEFGVVALPEQFSFAVKNPNELLLTLGYSGDPSAVDLKTLDKEENILKIRLYFDQLVGIVEKLTPKAVEETKAKEVAQDEEEANKLDALVRAVATAKVGQAGDGGPETSEDAGEAPDREPPESREEIGRLQKAFADNSLEKQIRKRAERHEFSWIYNHVLFDLMGRHGIMPSNLVMNELQIIVNTHLGTLTDQQIKNLFANPRLRLDEVKNIYLKLANNPEFVRGLRSQYTEHIGNCSSDQKEAFLASTGFDELDDAGAILTKRSKQLDEPKQVDAFQQKPVKQAETALAAIAGITVDGAQSVNFERAVEALSLAMGSAEIANHLGLTFPETKADLRQFVEKLSANRLALIFFADPNKPNSIDPATLQLISDNVNIIRALLISALLATSIDHVVDSATDLKRVLGIIEISADSLSESEVDVGVVSIQTLTGAMPMGGSSKTEVAEALTADERVSHTQELMDQYQQRIQKIWNQLDDDTQLEAYFRLHNLVPNDANRKILLDKVKHLRNPETGRLPWNPNLFGLFKWEDFLRKSHNRNLLQNKKSKDYSLDLVIHPTQDLQTDHVKTTTALREAAAEGFLKNLSGQQVEQLQFSHLIVELEKGILYGQLVADKLTKDQEVEDLEYRSALGVMERVESRLQLLKQQSPLGEDRSFNSALDAKVIELTNQYHFVLQSLLAHQPKVIRPTKTGAEELVVEAHEAKVSAGQTEQTNAPSSQLNFVELYQALAYYQVPEIVLASMLAVVVTDEFSPGAEVADGVTPENLLTDPRKLSLSSLNEAARRQNEMTDDARVRINSDQQNNQALADVAALAAKASQIIAQSKGNWVLAAGLAIKSYFTDKEFRERINRILAKAARIAMGGFIAGGALVGFLLQKLIGAVGAWGGFAGGAAAGAGLGFLVGGPVGAVIGGIGGGVAGYMAGTKLAALNASAGAELIPPGFTSTTGFGATTTTPSTTVAGASPTAFGSGGGVSATGSTSSVPASAFQSNAFSSVPSTSGSAGMSHLGTTGASLPTTSAAVTGGTVTAATGAPLLGSLVGLPIMTIIPGLSLLVVAMLTMYTLFVIFSAFLIPLPVGNLSGTNATQSKYATLNKRASPSIIADDQTATVIYKVTLQSRRNYRLKVTAVTDSANTAFTFQSSRPTHVNPQVSPPASLLNPRIALTDFSTNFENQTQEKEYSVTFTGGKQVMVSNTVTIVYDVQDSQGNAIATGETLSATANVNIGDHGVACWPTSGNIWQLPGGSFSHRPIPGLVLDAYDIVAPEGTKIFSPYDGWAHTGDFPPRKSYGKFVIVDSYVKGHWVRLMYGHFKATTISSRASDAFSYLGLNHDPAGASPTPNNNVGEPVAAGQLLGTMDSTGYSFGHHLHYELIHLNGLRHSLDPSDRFTLEDLIPQVPREGDDVRTCYK